MTTTVKALIEQLKLLPPDSIMLVDGYEGGYADVGEIKTIHVELNVHTEDYYGPHEETATGNAVVVIIRRAPNPGSGS